MDRQLDQFLQRHPRLKWLLAIVLVGIVIAFGRPQDTGRNEPLRPGESREISGFARVVDGDSLFVGGNEVRLVGIDAPEGPQTCERAGKAWNCGEAARGELERLIGRQKVNCSSVERDKHGRYLGTCQAGGRTLNAAMVESGLAVSYGGYRDEERAAKAAKRGLWSGTFQMPREWRRERGIGG